LALAETFCLNCGILAGKTNSILQISREIYDSTIDLDKKFGIPDQPAFNFIIRKKLYKETLFTSLDDGWSTNLGVIKFDSETPHIKNFILNNEPYIDETGIIKNSKGNAIYIIHQYNRNSFLNEKILEKYGK